MAEIDDYVERAATAIRRVLDEHHAVVQAELQSRIAEGEFADSTNNINPHHITTALRDLGNSGQIIWDRTPARGGQIIATIQPADQQRRTTKIEVAAARKRLLFARYSGWAQGTKRYPQGLIGPAGESAVRAAILAAGSLQPAFPNAGEASKLLGVDLPGAVDSAGYMVPFSAGIPGTPVTVLIEVKNIRSWIYPTAAELYQVLHKASVLQLARPAQQILPILICRRAHPTTFYMASQLGFVVIDMERQFVADVVTEAELLEVRNELHFHDLSRDKAPRARVRDRLQKVIPGALRQVRHHLECHLRGARVRDVVRDAALHHRPGRARRARGTTPQDRHRTRQARRVVSTPPRRTPRRPEQRRTENCRTHLPPRRANLGTWRAITYRAPRTRGGTARSSPLSLGRARPRRRTGTRPARRG